MDRTRRNILEILGASAASLLFGSLSPLLGCASEEASSESDGQALTAVPWALLMYTVADDRSGGGALDTPAKNELKSIFSGANARRIPLAAQIDFKKPDGVFRAALTMPSDGTAKRLPAGPFGFEESSPRDTVLWRQIQDKTKDAVLRVQRCDADLNSARSGVLSEFLRFGMGACPAERYVVCFYGHSSGPMGMFFDQDTKSRVAKTLRLNELAAAAQVLKGRSAVVLFRDCFMSTLETAFEFRDVAPFLVASQSLVPIAGIWPWTDLVRELRPETESGEAALMLAKQLGLFLDVPENRAPFADAPVSVLETDATRQVAGPLKALANALEDARRDEKQRVACAGALDGARVGLDADHDNPGDPGLLDVPRMCDNLARLGISSVAGPAVALREVVTTKLVRFLNKQKNRYRGISIYYKPVKPEDIAMSVMQIDDVEETRKDAEAYKKLALNTATGWDRLALNPLTR